MKNKGAINLIIVVALAAIVTSCDKDEDPPDPVIDIEGNTYKTVRIGNQVLMAENLRTTRFNDGTDVALITDNTDWGNLTTPGYCWYNNEEADNNSYGPLYNGYTVSTGKLCPTGWHVPAREEWQQLREFLGDTLKGGGKLKETGTTHWLTPNRGADNTSGFTALAAGIRYFEGSYKALFNYTCFWSATETGTNDEWYLSLYFGDALVNMSYRSKKHGFSVRCAKD